jgi:hypothetical protein
MSVRSRSDALNWTFNKSDVGNTSGFRFSVLSELKKTGNIRLAFPHTDDAPDSGMWTYDLSVAPPAPPPVPTPAPVAVKPLVAAPTAVPSTPVAGARFTVSFKVTRSDTGEPLTTGKMICDPSVAGTVLRHAESFKGGTAKLTFAIPKSARGKQLKVKVTIKNDGQSATRVASFRIR